MTHHFHFALFIQTTKKLRATDESQRLGAFSMPVTIVERGVQGVFKSGFIFRAIV
jgi:hypothetical protein